MDSVNESSSAFAHNGSSILLNFGANSLQNLADERWGLDNVKVEVAAVQVLAVAWLFGSGLVGLLRITHSGKKVVV